MKNHFAILAIVLGISVIPNIPHAFMDGSSKEKVAMLVPNSIYLQLKTRLDRYVDDVTGFDIMICNGSWSDPLEVRAKIQDIYSLYNVCGAILVGDIPIAYYKTGETPYGVLTFPTDLYYMDLNGLWTDTNQGWIFENRSDPDGADIWVSRMKTPTDNLTLLESYFDKNHLIRSNPTKLGALVFEDAGPYFGQKRIEALKNIYNETDITAIYEENETTKSNYINALQDGYEAVWISCHGSWTRHYISEPNGGPAYFEWYDAKSIENGSVFYLLHSCSVGRYDLENYLAGWYIFGNSNGLAALASTIYWESIYHDVFIRENENSYLGKAFLQTIRYSDDIAQNDAHPDHIYVIRCLYYGAVLIGDPLISIGSFSPIHDVAVKDVASSKTVVAQGFTSDINVTVVNEGNCLETFNVTAYANTTVIGIQTINNMPDSASTILLFTWNTTGFDLGDYTISANATIVSGEIYTTDNSYTDGKFRVNMVGDVAPEYGLVDRADIVYVAIHFGAEKGQLEYEPNADINDDGIIDIVDIVIVAIHFGETDP